MGEKKIVLTEKMIDEKLERFANRLAKTNPREYMDFQEFREKVRDWSESTIMRRHKEDGFPLVKEKGGYSIPREACKLWFKKRETTS